MFNNTVKDYLVSMGFDPVSFYQKISQVYPSKEYLFEKLIQEFCHKRKLENSDFNSFANQNSLQDNSLFNVLYELFNNIRYFKNGGKFELFKCREAAWGLPSNKLDLVDIYNSGDLVDLPDNFEIFRGMSKEEYDTGDFGQSWSRDYNTAYDFSKNFYTDNNKGVVVKVVLGKGMALHYDRNKEYEVIIKKGSIDKTDVVVVSS